MADHLLFTGTDGDTAFLLTIWDDGTHELATRPAGAGTSVRWSPPTTLTPVPALAEVRP